MLFLALRLAVGVSLDVLAGDELLQRLLLVVLLANLRFWGNKRRSGCRHRCSSGPPASGEEEAEEDVFKSNCSEENARAANRTEGRVVRQCRQNRLRAKQLCLCGLFCLPVVSPSLSHSRVISARRPFQCPCQQYCSSSNTFLLDRGRAPIKVIKS